MDTEDRRLFEATLRKSTETLTGDALDEALGDLGWREALVDDAYAATSTMFRLQGTAAATSTALDDVLLHALGRIPDPSMAIVLPAAGRCDEPVCSGDVHGLATARVLRAERALLVTATDDGAAAVEVPPDTLTRREIGGVDPLLGLVEVRGHITAPGGERVPWDAAVAAGQVAVATELVGVASAMLRLGRDHAVARVQFGRPIASFQAVRHRLADCLVAVEAADAAVTAAWTENTATAAALAKAIAARSARTVARHTQQVLGGMGFTAEHPLHRYVRRSLALDQLLGSSQLLTAKIGEQIRASGQLPTMLPL
jgi:Acyl-CoA dehydrogenase, C-terminal domain